MSSDIHKRIKTFINKCIKGISIDDETYFTYSDVCLLIKLYHDKELLEGNDELFNTEEIEPEYEEMAEDCYNNWYDKDLDSIKIEKRALLYGFINGYEQAKKRYNIAKVKDMNLDSAFELQYCLECKLMPMCTRLTNSIKK